MSVPMYLFFCGGAWLAVRKAQKREAIGLPFYSPASSIEEAESHIAEPRTVVIVAFRFVLFFHVGTLVFRL